MKWTKRKPSLSDSYHTLIAESVVIIGDLKSKGIIRIDGRIEGNLYTEDRVVIGKTGEVLGDIESDSLDVEGKITGNVKVTHALSIKKSAIVQGKVEMGTLAIEHGAIFNATSNTLGIKKGTPNTEKVVSTKESMTTI